MNKVKAYIPYSLYWSSPFARWQGEFAHLHSMKFAAKVGKDVFESKGLDLKQIDFALYGMTVPQHRSFYGAPWFNAMLGAEELPGTLINKACATGTRMIASAAAEIMSGAARVALVASGDRTSNSAHVYYPAPDAPGGSGVSEDIVMESFNRDPYVGCSMLQTAENVAKRFGISTEEQHEVALMRSEQYQMALANDRAFQKRYMPASIDVPTANFRKTLKSLEGDAGVYPSSPEKIAQLKPVLPEGSVTFAAQTHPADGNAGLLVVDSFETAKGLSGSDICVEVVGWGTSREQQGHMPAAPISATQAALTHAGISVKDLSAIKSHNPFAVNDIALSRELGIDLKMMNNYGSSLVWGHPQGPTALRSIIELIEELVINGGGYGLFTGCAAGDSGMSLIIKVS